MVPTTLVVDLLTHAYKNTIHICGIINHEFTLTSLKKIQKLYLKQQNSIENRFRIFELIFQVAKSILPEQKYEK